MITNISTRQHLPYTKPGCFVYELAHRHELNGHLAPPSPSILNLLICIAEAKTGKRGALGSLGEERTLAHLPVLTFGHLCPDVPQSVMGAVDRDVLLSDHHPS